jgi:hypothetical protein
VQSTFVGDEELASLCFFGGFFHDSVHSILNQKSEGLRQKIAFVSRAPDIRFNGHPGPSFV